VFSRTSTSVIVPVSRTPGSVRIGAGRPDDGIVIVASWLLNDRCGAMSVGVGC
jgi:hypothetical protein